MSWTLQRALQIFTMAQREDREGGPNQQRNVVQFRPLSLTL